MLIINLLNGVFLAGFASFVIGAALLAVAAVRRRGPEETPFQARVHAAFGAPGFRNGRTLIIAGAAAAVISGVVVFVLRLSLPLCPLGPHVDAAMAMCLPSAPIA